MLLILSLLSRLATARLPCWFCFNAGIQTRWDHAQMWTGQRLKSLVPWVSDAETVMLLVFCWLVHFIGQRERGSSFGFFVSVCLLWYLSFLSFCFWYLSFLIFLAFLCFCRTLNFTAFLSLVCVGSLLHVNLFGHESTLITKPLTTKVITMRKSKHCYFTTSQPWGCLGGGGGGGGGGV